MDSETDFDAGEPDRSDVSGAADATPFAPVEPASTLVGAPPEFPAPPPPPLSSSPPTMTSAPMTPMPPMPPPPPGYGYQPYGYGYGYGNGYPNPQVPSGTNGMAIAALVLGICGFFFVTSIVGLVLGIAALAAVRKSGQRGRGLAISGIVLSSLWIALFGTLIVVAVVNTPDPARRDAAGDVVKAGAVGFYDLRPGDCFTVPAGMIGSTDGKRRTLPVVPCSTPHDSEVIGSFNATDSYYPGADGLRGEAGSQCVKALSAYLVDPQSMPNGSFVQYIFPNEQAWDQGYHRGACFAQFPSATLTRSIHRDASSYTADQLRYVNAFRPVFDAASQLNATAKTASLPELQRSASDIASGLQTEIAAMTSAPWPADVQPSIDALVAKHRQSAQLWSAAAAGATDETSYEDYANQANGDLDLTDMAAVRSALGLTMIKG